MSREDGGEGDSSGANVDSITYCNGDKSTPLGNNEKDTPCGNGDKGTPHGDILVVTAASFAPW